MKRNLTLPQKLSQKGNESIQPKQNKTLRLYQKYNLQNFQKLLLPTEKPTYITKNSQHLQKTKRTAGCSLPKIDKYDKKKLAQILNPNYARQIKIEKNARLIELNKQQQQFQLNQNPAKMMHYLQTLQLIKNLKQCDFNDVCSSDRSQKASTPNISILLERRGFDSDRQHQSFKLKLTKSNFELNKLADKEEIIDNREQNQQKSLQKYFNEYPIRKRSNYQ